MDDELEMDSVIRDAIVRNGQAVIVDHDRDNGLTRFHTVGNHERGLPELVLIANVSVTDGFTLMNIVSQAMQENGRPFLNGEKVGLVPGGLPLKVTGPLSLGDYVDQAEEYYGVVRGTVSAMQVLIPDRRGIFPGETGCTASFNDQPVLPLA